MHIIGHSKIINFLDRYIRRNSTSAAYLFFGVEHLGKFTLALDFAKKITGQQERHINPDIIIIRPESEEKKGVIKKKDIKIGQVREMQKELSLTPYFGKCKVAIIDDAERLTVAAQNALLKILEEPDSRSILILVCHNQEKILPTIKSRSVIKNFNAVSPEEIALSYSDGEMSQAAIFWSLGRPGLAIEFAAHPEKLQALEKNRAELVQIFQDNLVDKFFLAEGLAKNVSELKDKLQSWVVLLRQNMMSQGNFLGVPLEKTLAIMEGITESLKLIQETNSNPRVVVENLLLKF